MTILISGWAACNYLTEKATTISQNILFNKFAYFFAVLAMSMAAAFSHYFSTPKKRYPKALIILVVAVISVLSVLSLSHYIAGTVSEVNGHLVFENGPLTNIYIIFLAVFLIFIIRNFYIMIKTGTPIQKAQGKLIIFGFSLSIAISMLTNAIIPALNANNFRTALYGPPILSLIVVSSISYAIIRQKLFDIRLIVARSLAYILLVVSLAAIATVVLYSSAALFFPDSKVDTAAKITFSLVTILLVFIFQPLRRFFDKATNKMFYRDAYDSQELLNDLNKSLVTTINLEEVLGKVSKIITSNVNTEFCTFAIRIPKENNLRLIGGKMQLQEEAIQLLITAVEHIPFKVIVDDEISTKRQHIKDLMQKAGVSVLVKMQGKVGGHEVHPGFILLGQKQSGSIYSSQDKTVLEIIADELVIAIQNSLRFEEIQQFNVTLQLKIDIATKELREVNSKLKDLDRTKDEFISMASHQLRTPLTTVKGYLSMVLEGDTGKISKSQKDLLQRSFDGADRMVYLIGDLLNVSRLQSGKFVIDNKPTDLSKLIETEMKQLQESAANHQLKLTFHKPENFPQLLLDETKIMQVVMNFMDNAIYYTPKGGRVDVALTSNNKSITFTVSDTGLGVPKADQHHLFTKFYRAGNARKMRPDGTGLGLFMAKKVVVAQGGAIVFKSTEGKGSTFGFTFPMHAVQVKN